MLVITIIIIIILATAVVVSIVGNNPIANARKAVDESNIKTYTHQIEMIKSKIILENGEYEFPTIYQIKEKLDKEKWTASTEIIMDEGIEKLKLITKEGYIFYITANETEYKGKGKVVDTSALKRDDVIELKAEAETKNGKNVRITSKAEDYYIIKYKIGEGEKWEPIGNGIVVEVPFGETIYAKLFYGENSGVEFKLKIGETNPTIEAKSIDTSNMKRKTDTALVNLFDITWGSEGTGTVEYEVTGNLLFDGSNVDCTNKTNTKDFELGTYNVKCIIKNPVGNYEASAQKEVKITTLANTSVIDENNGNVSLTSNAIYSKYDLAYFRDLVNEEGKTTINGKLMDNIDLANVCGENIGNWIPIGKVIGDWESYVEYNGIFDGSEFKVNNLYINNSLDVGLGLFGAVNAGTIKNLTVGGKITGTCASRNLVAGNVSGGMSGGIIAAYWRDDEKNNQTNISNLHNEVNVETRNMVLIGGIVGYSAGTDIKNCSNIGNIIGMGGVGGIVGNIYNEVSIENNIYDCYNTGEVQAVGETKWWESDKFYSSCVGGIVGLIDTANVNVKQCYNKTSEKRIYGKYYFVGGIVGATNSSLEDCYNFDKVEGDTYVGGIAGGHWGDAFRNVYNKGNIIAKKLAGGIVGDCGSNFGNNFVDIGTIDKIGVAEIYGKWGEKVVWENGTWLESTMISEEDIKGWSDVEIKEKLGNNFKKDTTNANDGLPILTWQNN